MDRRRFTGLCASALGAWPLTGIAAADASRRDDTASNPGVDADASPGPRTRLLFEDGSPVRPQDLAVDEAWVFGYPYVATPCFVARTAGDAAPATGGVVAYSAICTHRMTHPSPPISHIAWRTEPLAYMTSDGARAERSGLVSCCSGRSLFDPSAGGAVLSGPAPAPLPRVFLELGDDASGGGLVAVASAGAALHERFLETFGFRLALESGNSDVRTLAGPTATVVPAARFSRQIVDC